MDSIHACSFGILVFRIQVLSTSGFQCPNLVEFVICSFRTRLLSAPVLHFPKVCFQFLYLCPTLVKRFCQGSLAFRVWFCNPFLLD